MSTDNDDLVNVIRDLFNNDKAGFHEWLRVQVADALAQLDPLELAERAAWCKVRGLPDEATIRLDRDRKVLLLDYGGKPLAEVVINAEDGDDDKADSADG